MENLLRDNKEKLFLWIDVETENVALGAQLNKPWQISWALYRNNKIEKEFDYYIKWPEGLKVSAQAAKITNFDPTKIERFGKSPEEVLKILDKNLNKADIIAAHSGIGFEAYLIPIIYKKLGQKPYNIIPKILDTFCIKKAIHLEIPYKSNENFAAWQYRLYHHHTKGLKGSLGALADEYGIPHDKTKLHSSIEDVRLNVTVWDKMKYLINIKE